MPAAAAAARSSGVVRPEIAINGGGAAPARITRASSRLLMPGRSMSSSTARTGWCASAAKAPSASNHADPLIDGPLHHSGVVWCTRPGVHA